MRMYRQKFPSFQQVVCKSKVFHVRFFGAGLSATDEFRLHWVVIQFASLLPLALSPP